MAILIVLAVLSGRGLDHPLVQREQRDAARRGLELREKAIRGEGHAEHCSGLAGRRTFSSWPARPLQCSLLFFYPAAGQ